MRRRSQGLGHPLPNLYTHLHRHVHTDLGDGNFILLGAAPSLSESSGTDSNTIMTPDATAVMLPAGGHIAPALTDGLVATRPAGGRPAPDINVEPVDAAATLPAGGIDAPYNFELMDDDEEPVDAAAKLPAGGINALDDDELSDHNLYFEFGTPACPAQSSGSDRPTALETFAMAIRQLPDINKPADLFR